MKQRFTRGLGFAAVLLVAVSGPAPAQDSKTMVMKLATATLNDAQHEWMKRFAAKIERNSGGRIKAEVYPASQLGAIPRQIEGTQLGSIQAWIGPPEFLVGLDQRFELLSVPGVFQNDQQALKILADPEFSKAFLSLGRQQGAYRREPVHDRSDGVRVADADPHARRLKGKKIRVLASPFQTEQIARLGGTGVPLTLGDVLPALQQGTLDGAMGALPVFSRAAILRQRQVHDRDRPRLHLQHRLAEQAVVRRLAGRPQGDRDEHRQAGRARRRSPGRWTSWCSRRKVWVDKGGELIACRPPTMPS